MLSTLLSAALFAATPEVGAPTPAMTESLEALARVTPWLSSPDAFRDPQHHFDVARSIDALAKLKHPFLRGPGTSSAGVAQLFANQATWARTDFLAGSTESARYRVRSLTQLCLSCHLREPTRDFIDAQQVVERLPLPPLEQAQFFALTRQFDRALALWRTELVKKVKLDHELYEQLEGLRLAMRVAVLSRDDAKLAQQLLAPQLTRRDLPGFAQRELVAWQKDVLAWDRDRFALADQTPATLVTRARLLVESSGATRTVAPVPERYIALLRAASYLDEAMRQAPEGPFRAEALYLLGVVHPTVSDSPLWQLEWMYLEACIRENAGTPAARLCAERLKERTWFSWRTGADIPAATSAALNDLMWTAKSGK
ncbi:MAG: hypothetical protein Q8L48_20225 [Archangium sp.]|nr:hypothetical protein [Archangium sp.]